MAADGPLVSGDTDNDGRVNGPLAPRLEAGYRRRVPRAAGRGPRAAGRGPGGRCRCRCRCRCRAYAGAGQNGSRSWRLSTFPEPVFGSSAAKLTDLGTL